MEAHISNPFKAIGKVFKKVVKVVKKIALPVLAIGAVVLTGGAALGILPSIGALGSSIGLSAGLSGILSTAGQSALMGFGGALLMGKNPIKGATMGFVTGGVLGGLGVMSNPLGIEKMATSAASAATPALPSAAEMANNAMTAAGGGAGPTASLGLDSLARGASTAGAGAAGAVTPQLAQSLSLPTVGSTTGAALTNAGRTGATGIGGFLERNPFLAAQVVQGLGSGLAAGAEAKQKNKDQKRREANYRDTSGLFRPGDWGGGAVNGDAPRDYRWALDRVTGQPYKEYLA